MTRRPCALKPCVMTFFRIWAVISQAADFVDLALVPGDPPKLWIDLITYVVMSPDPRTFCLVQDRRTGHETLFSSNDRAEMVRHVGEHVAHRVVERERLAEPVSNRRLQIGHSSAALLLAWLSGFALGALLLLILMAVIARPL